MDYASAFFSIVLARSPSLNVAHIQCVAAVHTDCLASWQNWLLKVRIKHPVLRQPFHLSVHKTGLQTAIMLLLLLLQFNLGNGNLAITF